MISWLKTRINNRLNRHLAPDSFVNVGVHVRNAWIAEMAARLPEGSRVLDAGAGQAPYRGLFNHCAYKTQDFARYEGAASGPQMQSWTYSSLDYVSDICEIPVPDNSFDAVLCTEVLEHVPRPIQALHEFSRILAPRGRLFLSAPLGCGLHQRPYHYYGGFTPHFYEKFLGEAGFEIIELRPACGLMKHAGQEIYRAGKILEANAPRHLPPWLKFLLMCYLPPRIGGLDEEVFVEEFAVGYMVEAWKR